MSERAADDAPTFSVIVTTHNRPHLLDEAITSVLFQTIADFELLVVDDASTPPAQPGNSDPRIHVIRREVAGGPAASRNEGLKASRGRYVAFLDDDDLFTPERLALGSGCASSAAPVSVCLATTLDQRARPWTTDLRRAVRPKQRPRRSSAASSTAVALFPQVGQVTILAEIAPHFDERLRVEEDIDWWITVSRDNQPDHVPQLGYVRRVHDRPRVRSESDLSRALESTQLVLVKNAAFFADHPAAAAARWRRIGLFNERLGRGSVAREAFRTAANLLGDRPRRGDMIRTHLPIPASMRTRL